MILADHCVFEATVRNVIAAGYAVIRLREIAPVNSSDPNVLALAVGRNEVLLTNDLGFWRSHPVSSRQPLWRDSASDQA
jgi:predicted nuclease of predicted toxin-antitoxin system